MWAPPRTAFSRCGFFTFGFFCHYLTVLGRIEFIFHAFHGGVKRKSVKFYHTKAAFIEERACEYVRYEIL